MTKYTAADFANAKFAEHEDGNMGFRSVHSHVFPWAAANGSTRSDEEMAGDGGWVPVPTKPTITESQFFSELAEHSSRFKAGYEKGFRAAGGEIIPAPEPTNTDRLERLIISAPGNFEGVEAILKRPASVRAWAEYLNDHGVTAAKED